MVGKGYERADQSAVREVVSVAFTLRPPRLCPPATTHSVIVKRDKSTYTFNNSKIFLAPSMNARYTNL